MYKRLKTYAYLYNCPEDKNVFMVPEIIYTPIQFGPYKSTSIQDILNKTPTKTPEENVKK